MRARSLLRSGFAGVALSVLAVPAMAENRTVIFNVPVDISEMPYIATFSVWCQIDFPSGDKLSQAQLGSADNRTDLPLSNGEFHGQVSVTITLLPVPEPNGWHCDLSVFPMDRPYQGFTPISQSDADSSTPPEHITKPGSITVTHVSGTFSSRRTTPLQTIPSPQKVVPPPQIAPH